MGQTDRRIEFDVEAVGLSAICLFIWLSLLSYDAGDSLGELSWPLQHLIAIDNAVYPPNANIQNFCGWFGALTANILIQSFGIASLLVATGLTVLSVWLFRVQTNYVPPLRQIGWVLIIIGTTTFFALMQIPTAFAPMVGPGGYLGAITSTWLLDHFAMLGALILTLAILLSGILLSTDYYVLRSVGWLILGGAQLSAAAARIRFSLPLPREVKLKRTSDVDRPIALASEAGTADILPPVRISGRSAEEKQQSDVFDGPTAESAWSKVQSSLARWLGFHSNPASTPPDAIEGLEPRSAVVEKPEESEECDVQFDECDDEADSDEVASGELIELTTDAGETLQLRADPPHETPVESIEPKVRPPKSKKTKGDEHADSLASMDDTKLPPGTDEYVLPSLELLDLSQDIDYEAQTVEVRRKAKILESTFKNFGFNVRVVEIETGPVIAQYEIELEAGLRLSKITSLADDLAIALRVPSVRIVAPIPGKNTVGIEVPNETRQVVRLREVIEEMGAKGRKAKIPLFLGKDVSGNPLIADLATLPHLLIAGRTGTGKSVCLNAIISSILMTRRPDEVRMLMIDPKMVEMIGYGRLPHLMHPVVTDMRKAEAILAWAVDKMEERYALLARAGVRHLTSYNELDREELLERVKPDSVAEADTIPDHLPFIVIVADEIADLMMTAGKDVEQHIIRLAQKSRAVGIHLILATQKPTVDVITGLIKSNLPARISFQVASRTDSRVVLDEMGADKLLGNGDMLFLWPGTSMLLRGQGTYMSDEEINRIVDHCSTGEQNFVTELVNLKIKQDDEEDAAPVALKKRDDLYAAAVDVVVREGRGSCSLLQRALGIGYGRAARLIDYMAEDGIVGQYAGSQAREVIISIADWEAMQAADGGGPPPSEPPRSQPANRSNKIRPSDQIHVESESDSQSFEEEAPQDLPWIEPTPRSIKRPAVPEPVAMAQPDHFEEDADYEYEDYEEADDD